MTQELVATLVAGTNSKLSLDIVQSLLEQTGATHTEWLKSDVASDLFYEEGDALVIQQNLKKILGAEPVDVIVQPVLGRQKKLLIADMESTIIEQEMLDEMADILGIREKVADITHRAMNGELDFEKALRERVALFAGQPTTLLDEAAKRITYMPGAKELVDVMRANGAKCWLVSGGFNWFVEIVTHTLGFDNMFANYMILENGKIEGSVIEPILGRVAKKALLEKACAEFNLSLADAVAVGDGANDVPMLSTCFEGGGLGVAYQAKPKVRAVIANQINYGDLTTLLYAQGYKS